MSTIGQRSSSDSARAMVEESRRRRRWRDRLDIVKAAGLFAAVALLLGTAFALVYLVVLAVRLAWGAS